jgi:TonB family protein
VRRGRVRHGRVRRGLVRHGPLGDDDVRMHRSRARTLAFALLLATAGGSAAAAFGPGPGAAPAAAAAQPGESPGDPGDPHDVPRLARLVRHEGTVVVEALLDSAGAVRAVNVLRSHPLLDDSATVEVARRRFPAALDPSGRAVPSLRTVPVKFDVPEIGDPRWPPFVASRCAPLSFAAEPDFRPDSTGSLALRWTASGPRSHELRLLLLTPDGVDVDTTNSFLPQRLLDSLDPDVPGWPTWLRNGKELREGTGGTIALRLPASPWWSTGRIALVALFHDAVDRAWVVRQAVYRVERDAIGPLLVRDASVADCLAGPFRP